MGAPNWPWSIFGSSDAEHGSSEDIPLPNESGRIDPRLKKKPSPLEQAAEGYKKLDAVRQQLKDRYGSK